MGQRTAPNGSRTTKRIAAVALAWAGLGCGEDADLGGPAPTPFWLDGGDTSGGNSDSAAGDSGGPGSDGGRWSDGGAGSSDAATSDASTGDTAVADADGFSADADSTAASDVAADAATDASGGDTAQGPEEQYFVSWLETAQQLQDPSPFGDSWAEQRTHTLGLVKVLWNGNSGSRWHQPCAMQTTANFSTKTLYSAAFLSSIPVQESAMARQGAQWTQAEELQVIGLKSGYTGSMPALGEKGHAAVIDSDKDGQPGATIHIDNSLLGKQNIQVAQRSKTNWTGAVQADGTVAAEPIVQTEQVVIAASLSLLVTKNNVKPLQGKPAETLLWRPLAEPIDCKALLAEPKKYAGRAWPP